MVWREKFITLEDDEEKMLEITSKYSENQGNMGLS